MENDKTQLQEIKLNDMQRDALQELANIGASHAGTALSKIVNKDIKIGIPNINVIPLEKTIDCVMDEEIVVGMYLKISKVIPTYSLLLLSFESALNLANMLLNSEPDYQKAELNEMEQSAIKEVGNIMISSFFDSVSELLGLTVLPGPPTLAYDMPAAVLDYLLIQMGEVANQAVIFEVNIHEEKHENFKINLFLMPEPESLKTIFSKLGFD